MSIEVTKVRLVKREDVSLVRVNLEIVRIETRQLVIVVKQVVKVAI
jgi:hypothetical protein